MRSLYRTLPIKGFAIKIFRVIIRYFKSHMLSKFEKIWKKLMEVNRVLLVAHREPDADTLGSAIALKIALEREGKDTTVACVDVPGDKFSFFSHIDEVVQDFSIEDFDIVVIVDAGAAYLTNFHLKYDNFFTARPIINIDHHGSNDRFGEINLVDSGASSCTMVIYNIFKKLEIEIDQDMATALLAGLYSDTGSFMHSNTSAAAYGMAADLVERGADMAGIVKNLFKTREVATLKLWGDVLQRTEVNDDNVVVSVVSENDLRNHDAEELSGIVDYLNMVDESKYSVLIYEDRKGHIKGSLRTRKEDVDVSRIAAVFGGGGHKKASGFTIDGRLSNIR